jgi:putrescine transport system permease protein
MVNRSKFVQIATIFGLIFLYAPIFLLIFYSFNESRLVTVWSGFSTKWYVALFDDTRLLNAAWISLRIAIATATSATILGTLAAYALTRYRLRKSGALFNVLIRTPLVMPEVIMGFSLLLLFVGMEQIFGFPHGRGMLTIWIAHTTLTIAYVTVVVAARLQELDRNLLLAATDLGATPLVAFVRITLPLIATALISGWLLAFTLSFDDLVIASFVSGPDSTTLPMMIYSSVRMGVNPKINALATLMIIVVTVMAVICSVLMMRLNKKA